MTEKEQAVMLHLFNGQYGLCLEHKISFKTGEYNNLFSMWLWYDGVPLFERKHSSLSLKIFLAEALKAYRNQAENLIAGSLKSNLEGIVEKIENALGELEG